VKGQPRVVVLIPYGLIVLILGILGVVIFRDVISRKQVQHGLSEKSGRQQKVDSATKKLAYWLLNNKRQFGLLLLSFVYYIAFEKIGFTLANVVFLILAFPMSGVGWKRSVIYTLAMVLILYTTAELMQMNVPRAPWFR
jgi:hypothetical protein